MMITVALTIMMPDTDNHGDNDDADNGDDNSG